ncbi:co-chaperone protein HscB [Beauveria brongniartii RCEF 3172]|uniref:Co-chaperone protein HscB n=1 Tax=Beauveria brongniartii RCEF 3172 TaxID=1081107 RepID=A0A162JHZ1_9HYPO|nr:co-chaperone protein HscB [Beauveria brongniartii RCEF 3172]
MRAAAAVLRGASAPSRRCARCHSSSSASLTTRRLPSARHASTGTSTAAAATTTVLPLLLRTQRPANTTNLLPSSPPPRRRLFSQHAADRADTSEPSTTTTTTTTASSPYYALFPSTLPLGPPPRGHFPIDVRQLRREFLQLQARAHPDMHAPGAAKSAAETRSALINEAYRTLANPLLRAQHLLALRGVDVAGDERLKMDAAVDDDGDNNNEGAAGLLMVVLEAREGIEEARTEADLEGLRTENDDRIREGEERLEEAFREDDVEKAKREAVKMRYWVNIKESLDNWEQGKPIVLQH